MAKLTRQELLNKQALQKAEEKLKTEAFQATLQKVLFDLAALASEANVSFEVMLREDRTSVEFNFSNWVSTILNTKDTEEWETVEVRERLQKLIAERNALKNRAKMAKDLWENMTEEQKQALRENAASLL